MNNLAQRLVASFDTLKPVVLESGRAFSSRAEAEAVCEEASRALGRVAAWKLGATTRAGREVLRLDSPFFGPLPEWRVFADGATLTGAAAGLRGVECEYGFKLARDARPDDAALSDADFLTLFASVHPAIEIPGSRFLSLGAYGGLGLVADFGAAGALVVGPGAPLGDPAALTRGPVRLSIDGREAAVGSAESLDGGALPPVRGFLAAAFARGYAPRAGQVIVTGSCTGYVIAPPGAEVVAFFDALGTGVRLRMGSDAFERNKSGNLEKNA